MKTNKSRLALGAASAAVAVGLAAQGNAAITTSGTTVTVAGTDNTTDAVDTATAGIGGSTVTVSISTGATVLQPGSDLEPVQQGAVAVINRGMIGTVALPVGLVYAGTPSSTDNTFDLNNAGTITGAISVTGVGGTINVVNTGRLGNGLRASAVGDVTIRTGVVSSTSSTAISASSSVGSSSVTVDGVIGSEATVETASALRGAEAFAISSVNSSTAPAPVTVDGVTTTTGSSTFDLVGGDATIAVEANGSTGSLLAVGLGSAAISVAGNVGAEDQGASLNALASFANGSTSSSFISTSSATGSSSESHSDSTTVGGAATITVVEGGSVSGSATATGYASADITVDGTIGRENAPAAVNARSSGQSRTVDQTNTYTNATGNYANTYAETNSATGGSASVTVGDTGIVYGNVNARADENATITNNGEVTGGLTARAREFVGNQQYASYNTGTFATSDGGSSADYTSGSSFQSGNEGGNASIANAANASTNSVSAVGLGGATVANAGTIKTNASVNSTGSTNSGSQDNTNSYTYTGTGEGSYLSAYAQTSDNTSTSTTIGGQADLTNAATGTIGEGNDNGVNVSGFAGAKVQNAGIIDANVDVSSTGFAFADESHSAYNATYDVDGNTVASNNSYEYASNSGESGGSASLTNAAGGLIGRNAQDPIFVSIYADSDASLSNAGRINGSVSVSAEGNDNTYATNSAYTFAVDPVTGVVTETQAGATQSTSASSGGKATLTNSAGGLIVGSVSVTGDDGVTVSNAGVVTGTTFAVSNTSASSYDATNLLTEVTTPGEGGGYERNESETTSSTSVSDGGDVTGTYAGFNGAVQFVSGGASDGSVTQIANGNSTANVTGTIYGNFSGSAFGSSYSTDSAFAAHYAEDVDGNALEYTSSDESSNTLERTGGNSSLVVSGGTITGSANVSADGNASVMLGNGAEIGGSLFAGGGSFGNNSTSSSVTTYEASYVDGDFAGYTSTVSSESTSTGQASSAAVSIGAAEVGGSVTVSGAKGGATLNLASAGSIGSYASVSASSFDSSNAYESTTVVLGDASTTTGTSQSEYTSVGGNASATVAGTIGDSLYVGTNAGNASVVLTGQVSDGVYVGAGGSTQTTETSSVSNADGETFRYASTYTPIGGTASLSVDAASLEVPANFGDIDVGGVSGSTVTIGAKSAVLAGDYETSLFIGGTDYANTFTLESIDPAEGFGTLHTVSQDTAVGGPAVLTNAGTIGFDDGDDTGTLASVNVSSIGGASAVNTGKIFGSLAVSALDTNTVTTVDQINVGDVTQMNTTTIQYTAVGGDASVTNNGLITGSVNLAGATGTVTNNGKIGGDIVAGFSVDNYTTTSVDTLVQIGEEQVTSRSETPFAQTYTINQNGTVDGDIRIEGAFGNFSLAPASSSAEATALAVDTTAVNSEGQPLTSAITATVNLGNNSVTRGGVYAEYDAYTGERFTNTVVNIASTARIDGGIYGVEQLNKQGTGTFTLTGPSYVAATDVDPATWTLDLGQFEILTGEVQLATADDGVFGIRGDVSNAASLVLGTRQTLSPTLFGSNLTSTGTQTVAGVDVYQQGDFVQTSSGTLTVAMMPSLIRVIDPAINGVAISSEPLGVQQIQFAQGLFTTPENAFGSQFAGLYAPSSWTIDGNLDLAGKVNVLMPKGGLFLDGQSLDLFSVSGTVNENATVATGSNNNFVSFDLVSRTSDGRTIVAVVADRRGYETVAANSNAAAAGVALTAALPGVVADLVADAGGDATFGSVQEFALTQDLATVLAGLDSQLTLAQATQALNELGGGSYYGSLATIRTTAPFVDVLSNRRLPEGATGFDLWIQPSGDFQRVSGDADTGASKIRSNNYGGSAGFGVATGSGEFGIGFGYGHTNSRSQDGLAKADADTWMVGGYARQSFGALTVAADLVFGWSKWDAYRSLPTLSRKATSNFDSKETRGDLRVEYAVETGNLTVSPFGQLEFRHYSFDGFAEEGAGSVGLAVEGSSKTVFTPTIGVKLGGEFETSLAKLRPEASISYSFQGDNAADRTVAFLGAPAQSFRLQGVDPDGFVTVQAGMFADIGTRSGVFVRANYSTGGGNNNAAIRTGVVIGF